MPEVELVRRIRAMATAGYRHKAVIAGIGDDCAVVRPDPKFDLVFTTDFVIEGRHFTRESHKPGDIGHKALARSLSDLAAMGSEPMFCLVSLAVPAQSASRWIDQFYRGLLALADRFRLTLAGGDLSQADNIVADVMCCGRVPRGKALLRSGARPGDGIYVTGQLGKPWQSNLRPEPRVGAGLAIRSLATAAMDLSDGISLDLHRLCLASKVSAHLDSASIPLMDGSTLEQALHGGEDYELLFTCRAGVKLPRQLKATLVGEISAGKPGSVRLDGRPMKPKGWDHFR